MGMNCRHCHSPLSLTLVDLGSAPPSNAYLAKESLHVAERWFPLRVLVCEACWLVQTEDFAAADELFDAEYAYFSSYSSTWLAHAEAYVAEMTRRFALGPQSLVVEVAANDGYLLQYVQARGIPCLGIEPTASTAAAAREKQIDVIGEFFGVPLASRLVGEGRRADLMTANNVLAHVPDINDFVAGFATLLAPAGVATFEFPHLQNLLDKNQFDTIYHEHFSYLSLTAVERIFSANRLAIFDVEEIPTHGGSLRVFAQRRDTAHHARTARVDALLARERTAGMNSAGCYETFQAKVDRVKNDFVEFLLEAKRAGRTVAAYGAAAKGNTLLNYAGVRPDLITCVADRNPFKQGHWMPGSRIPIVDEHHLTRIRPDYVVILPWNLRAEVMDQLGHLGAAGCRFVTAVPALEVTAASRMKAAA
jgi:SAM-dependent methyltransferase